MSANSLKTITLSAIFGAAAMAVAGSAAYAADAKSSMDKPAGEKCYGVAKAGKNDCQTAASSCAGTSKKDAQTDAWISVPKGTCDKIAGGKLTSS